MTTDSEKGLLDRSDTRVRHETGIADTLRAFAGRVRAGDLGSLPVVVGLVIICTVFTSLNPIFIAPNNLVNLLYDCSAVGMISLGIVCVLLLGEIDLSVGSMSGVASALLGVFWVNAGLPLPVVLAMALVAGAAVGAIYALLRVSFGMPSFVATLSGLLALLGFQLYLLGNSGSINLPYGSWMVNFGQLMVMPDWLSHLLALAPGVAILVLGMRRRANRARSRLHPGSGRGLLVKALAVTVGLELAVFYLNLGRGVPWMFGFFALLVMIMNYAITRTRWGRSVLAVGGNAEAARRAGINVKRVYFSCFMLCSTLAALGGILSASRLATSSQQAGTGDVNLNAIAAAVIGGTSLFGGRGSAWSAILGIIVIQSISNGLTLLNLSSSWRYMITGAVLAIAVIVDALARRSRTQHGRA
ncbi:sugar ABC transporter permease [Falsirhodobacter xinxiangensis]|uniref:sugar ABC transporter permease n=1 Tax=Falsirhodobacter xinxiangensis TaxID=2530049 RepID=UPI0010A9C00F|nr:sugar ABC transporter permease [Rhodobacter xinxiangensis]